MFVCAVASAAAAQTRRAVSPRDRRECVRFINVALVQKEVRYLGRARGGSSRRFAYDSTTENTMADATVTVTRQQLVDRLNEDLSREYQAIIAYVVYSQVLKGPEYMSIAEELETHAKEELEHAITVAKHIDYLGGMPTTTPQPVKVSDDARV